MPLNEEDLIAEPDTCETCGNEIDDCSCIECEGNRRFLGCHEMTENSICNLCNRCEDCCSCHCCNACENHVDDYCSNCDNCTDCCGCHYCEGCSQNTNQDVCGECENCESCGCVCGDEDPPPPEVPGVRPAPTPTRDSGNPIFTENSLRFWPGKPCKANPSKRFVSAEIEVATMPSNRDNTRRLMASWSGSIVSDGSLDGSMSFEINTAPASGSEYIRQMEAIFDHLKTGQATTSTNCGIHVHIDARDYTYYDMRRLLLLYAKIEPALYRIVAPSRRTNHYCVPCGPMYKEAIMKSASPKETKKNLYRAVYATTPSPELHKGKDDKEGNRAGRHGATRRKYHSCGTNVGRYAALNIHSWFYRGTVECRMHHGTVNRKGVQSWGIMWARLLDLALMMTERQIAALPEDAMLALLQATATLPETHAWIISRALFFAKLEGATGAMKIPGGFTMTCNELRAMRQPDTAELNDAVEDNG